jgi:hypothetical protein
MSERVVAILSADDDEVRLIGFGEYVGDDYPPGEIGDYLRLVKHPNPKIVLEDGSVVWGFQCWWHAADDFNAFVAGRRVVQAAVPPESAEVLAFFGADNTAGSRDSEESHG